MEGALNRLILTDEQWERVAPHLPGKIGDPGRSGKDNRLFLEGVLWIARAGAPWRDLPETFGNWNSQPTVESEVVRPSRLSSTAILRLPHIGLSARNAATASTRAGGHWGRRGRLGRRERGSGAFSQR